MTDNTRATIESTIKSFVDNNTLAVRTKNASLFSSVLADQCVRIYRPQSFIKRHSQFFQPEITNDDYEAQMQVELQSMLDLEQKITRTVIDAPARRAVVWLETVVSTGESETPVEVIFDLEFTNDGTKISQILQFVDTYESTKVLEQMLAKAEAVA